MEGRADDGSPARRFEGVNTMRPAPRPCPRWGDRLPDGWSAHAPHRPARLRAAMNDTADRTPSAADKSADGIRWELVNRMKALIAAGELDTPERWALAEEFMLRAVDPPSGKE